MKNRTGSASVKGVRDDVKIKEGLINFDLDPGM